MVGLKLYNNLMQRILMLRDLILRSIQKQMCSKTTVEGRLPNQTLYSDLLNCNPNSLNLTSPTIPVETKVIVIVCSKPDDIETRMTIRQTWANPLFSKAVKNKLVSAFFLIGAGLNKDVIDNEQQSFSDILQVKVYDTYSNLVYKLLAAYRWINSNYPEKFVLKIDSDVVVLLDKIVGRLGSGRKRTIQCFVHKSPQPIRNSESPWYIPETVYPERFLPDYCSGPLYLLTPAALQAILEASQDAMVFEVEDAFFTGLLAKKGLVELRREAGIWNHWVGNTELCNKFHVFIIKAGN
uniref:Hexosyltransferase n=1 Tax=Angiostrongylus cantonensis TaxID=6313 RepID=A0A0K0D1K1_ANGCA